MMSAVVGEPVVLDALKAKRKEQPNNYLHMFNYMFSDACHGTCVIIVSHAGTIRNMLKSHAILKGVEGHNQADALKPRNSQVIQVDDRGSFALLNPGAIAAWKSAVAEDLYFTSDQFQRFAESWTFEYKPPPTCKLLLVRHSISVSNISAAKDGLLTPDGVELLLNAARHVRDSLLKNGITRVKIFSSDHVRTIHTSSILYNTLQSSKLYSPSWSPKHLGVIMDASETLSRLQGTVGYKAILESQDQATH
mmetsp:Transcript_16107/g.34850  ORF Transcript_16107/g.34850 Transcript_16107/m.34850 type:complete len:250 (+) Transcript_16107:59-808(+)